jgi:DNA-directed RNA polymerase specialized sigma24 family protein
MTAAARVGTGGAAVGWPTDDELLAAWRRACADPTDGAAFVDLAHRPLVQALAARRPNADPDAVYTAAADALLWFAEHPSRYDPAKSPLARFLLLVAERRLFNAFESDVRHRRRLISGELVELAPDPRNEEADDDSPSFDAPELQPALAGLTETDRRVLELMRDGERHSAVFAALLGIGDRPADDQRHEVKKAKDRIVARLRRAAGGGNG